MKIVKVSGREIYDSCGLPTLLCEIELEGGIVVMGSAPAGSFTSLAEAVELRDGGTRLFGLGVKKAIERLEMVIAPLLIGKKPDLMQGDLLMLQLDGTADKRDLGVNTMIAVSAALARAQSLVDGVEIFELIAHLASTENVSIPFPMVSVFQGNSQYNKLAFQDIMVVPLAAPSYRAALEIIVAVVAEIENICKQRGIYYSLNAQGSFTPHGIDELISLEIVAQALESKGRSSCVMAIDVGASSFYDLEQGLYRWREDFLTAQELIEMYHELTRHYAIYSIEDGLYPSDIIHWQVLTRSFAHKVQIVGDDFFAPSLESLKQSAALESASAIVLKPGDIGTFTESLDLLMFAKKNYMNVIISHKERETSDTSIVDFAVGASAGQVKFGGLRGDRLSKYNRLLIIEDLLLNQFND